MAATLALLETFDKTGVSGRAFRFISDVCNYIILVAVCKIYGAVGPRLEIESGWCDNSDPPLAVGLKKVGLLNEE